MKIHRLSLRNFRCFREAEIVDLADLNFFGGLNYSGKSSILDAIAFALTGTCRGVDTGRGLGELRTQANGMAVKERMLVTLQWSEGAGKNSGFGRSENHGPRADLQASIEAEVGLSAAGIRSCLYAGELLRLERKEAQALIFGLIPKVTVDVPQDVQKLLQDLGLPAAERAPLSRIESWYETFYATRRDTARALKMLGELPPKPDAPDWLGDSDHKQARLNVAERVAQLRKERDALVRSNGAAVAERNAAKDKLERARAALLECDSDLAGALGAEEIQAKARELLKKKQEIDATNAEIRAKLTDAHNRMAEAKAILHQAKLQHETVTKLKDECPTCLSKLKKVERQRVVQDLEKKMEAAGLEHDRAKIELEAISQPADMGAVEREFADLEGKEQRWIRARQRKGEVQELIAKLEEQLTAPVTLADTAELDKRIATGESRFEALVTYSGLLKRWTEATTQAEKWEKDLTVLDRLVEVFGPDGLRKSVAESDELGRFEAALHGDMAALGFDVDLKPLLTLADDPHVNGRPARLLSESEGILFSLAFACAVAKWSGLGIVCVDRWDALDEVSTGQAQQVLQAHAELQQLIFLTPKGGVGAYVEKCRQIAATGSNKVRYYHVHAERGEGSKVTRIGG